ncbi:MAG TPA: DUF3253 domain-containing protein [Microvirga sp.]|jgi:hypothetical protein|nr:DUF3253 domain-containing protein [Microvirga sp.]
MSRPTVDPNAIKERLLAMLAERRPGKTLGPQDVARALGGDHPDGWGPLMQPIRRVAVRLMKQGRVVLLRKGRPVDPDDFRGVYRLALPGTDAAPDAEGD